MAATFSPRRGVTLLRITQTSSRVSLRTHSVLLAALLAALLIAAGQAQATVSAAAVGNDVTVSGDGADDSVVLSCAGGNLDVAGVVIAGGPIACALVDSIAVVAGAGNDTVVVQGIAAGEFTALDDVTLDGGDGFDIARVEGSADEELFTLRPSELAAGGGAVDLIGAETVAVHIVAIEALELYAAEGDDTLLGGDLSAATGLAALLVDGGADDDLVDLSTLVGPVATVQGGAGDDTLTGSTGADTISGGPGADLVTAGAGDDLTLWRIGDGPDTLLGGVGDDRHVVTAGDAGESFVVELRQEGTPAESIRISRNGLRVSDLLQFEDLDIDTGLGVDGVLIRESFSAFTFGAITVTGSADPDSVTVRGTGDADRYVARSDGGVTTVERQGAASYILKMSETEELNVRGRGGNDVVNARRLGSEVELEIFGGGGSDVLIGGPGSDKLKGGRGNDSLRGRGGDDRIWGARGRDRLRGGRGSDRLFGSTGKDIIKGGAGDDRAIGGPGPDDLSGGADADILDGGRGDDFLFGLGGDDTLRGRAGDDTLNGGTGSDDIDGGLGFDTARDVEQGPETSDLLRRLERIE